MRLALCTAALLGACFELRDESGVQDCSVREKASQDRALSGCLSAAELMASGAFDAKTGLPCILATSLGESSCVVADADVLLCSQGGAIDVQFELTHSGVVVDCNGQRISHSENQRARSAFRTPYEYSVSDIEIRSCLVEYTERYGVDLKRLFRGEDVEGPMLGHESIVIRDTEIFHSSRVGIYVGQNSRDVRIENVRIREAFSGIYLEAGSRRTHVFNSVVLDSYERAGIHIDSSTDNIVEASHFSGNQGGGIRMYKNCGEVHGQVCPIRRTSGASNNLITGNQFYGGDVSVAYRQHKLYGPDHCAGISVLGYWRDQATDNTIVDNLFMGGANLHLRDGGNLVANNEFLDSLLVVGATDPLGDPPVEMFGRVEDNRFTGASWIGVVGETDHALGKVTVSGNTVEESRCMSHYRPQTACSSTQTVIRAGADCYGAPREIASAVCR